MQQDPTYKTWFGNDYVLEKKRPNQERHSFNYKDFSVNIIQMSQDPEKESWMWEAKNNRTGKKDVKYLMQRDFDSRDKAIEDARKNITNYLDCKELQEH